MVIFESTPAFFGIYIPLVLLGFFGIIFEERIAEAEQRLGRKMRAFVRSMRKAVKKSKKEWSRQYGR